MPERLGSVVYSEKNHETEPRRVHVERRQAALSFGGRKTRELGSGGRSPIRGYGHVFREPGTVRGAYSENGANDSEGLHRSLRNR